MSKPTIEEAGTILDVTIKLTAALVAYAIPKHHQPAMFLMVRNGLIEQYREQEESDLAEEVDTVVARMEDACGQLADVLDTFKREHP